MSQGYAVDYYGTTTYGFSQPLDYSVAQFTATQTGYGSLALNWKSPNSTPWKTMELVSSLYGYPSTPADGVVKFQTGNTGSITTFEDANLLPGRIYYYTIFLSLEASTWNSGTSYPVNTVVLLNGQYWISLVNSNIGNTPAVGSSFWANTQYVPTWFPAGYTASLIVNNYGYSQHLYDRTPQPYKITASDIFTNAAIDNPALLHYLSIFGFFFDMTRTEYDLYLQGNNPDLISSNNLDWLGKELGITTDYLVSPQLRRNRVKNAATNYRLRGTSQGIHNAIAEVSGWDSKITYSANLMLSNDQAAFVSPQYLPWSAYEIYFTNQLVQFNGYNYKCLTQAYGNTQAPTGLNTANTWWTPLVSTTASPILDTTTLKNPKNFTTSSHIGAYSTWGSDTFSQLNGVYTGLPHPTIPSINNWNALSVQLQGAPSGNDLRAYGITQPTSPPWSNATNYVVNNYVSTNAGSNIWQALKPSGPATIYGVITPGTNETFWLPLPPVILSIPAGLNIIPDSIPLHKNITWNSSTTFHKGDRVNYQGIIYEAIRTNINSGPTGFYTHNSNWIFIQPSDYAYTASAYEAKIATSGASQQTYADIVYIDDNSTQSTSPNFASITAMQNYLDRFVVNYADLNGIDDNSLALNGYQWSGAAGLWQSSAGMAFVNQAVALTNTYSVLTIADGRANLFLSLTFVTDYADPIHYGHGILFRYQDANNFWYTTRQSLYLVSGGTETLMASWTRLVDGDRMTVTTVGNAISVRKYKRDGTGGFTTLIGITNSTLQTATIHGLIQKYSPTGAV